MKRTNTRPLWTFFLVAAILLGIVAACSPIRPGGEAAAPNAPAPLATPDPATLWERVQAAGKIVVGTAADYPPFESYDESFRIAGFDPALMRALGDELGVEVEFKDFAFDGLGQALLLGQIDAAIAAISQTPERARLIDFTATYFVSTDGWLASTKADRPTVNKIEDLKGLRIGAQRGSIYQDWLEKNLVEPGIISAQDLILYEDVQRAVLDLGEGRVDLFVLDLPAAQAFADGKDIVVGAVGLNQQRYAIALPKGAAGLRDALDGGLATLQETGAVAQLAEEYLALPREQLLPLPAEPVAPAPGAAPELSRCIDGMAWVADLSYGDDGMAAPPVLVPGQPFRKGWQVRNTGNCTWDSSYSLSFVFGNLPGAGMGGAPVAISGQVPPGATVDLYADLVAPLIPGTYQGIWQMHNSAGNAFGESLRAGIQVAGAPTPTPAPTQTPVPGIVFYPDRTFVKAGEPVTFYWDVQDASAVYFYAAGQDWRNFGVAATGNQAVYPAETTTYNLRVEKKDGAVEERAIRVDVEAVEGAPQIDLFTVTPNGTIAVGQCVDLAWQVSGDSETIAVTRNDAVLWDSAPVAGSLNDCPPDVGNYDYAVTATGAGGAAIQSDRVTVSAEAAPAAKAQPGPAILSFSVTPASVALGGCVTVDWTVGGDVQNVRLTRNDDTLLDNAPLTASGPNCLTTAGTYTYVIEATNADGVTATAQATVTVTEPTPAPPVGDASGAGAALLGKTLNVISYFDGAGALLTPLAGTKITALFQADGTVAGTAGCNTYGGGFQAPGAGAITIGPLMTTQMFCAEPEGVMNQEAQYLSVLQTAARYEATATELTLYSGADQVVATFTVGD